MKSYKIKSNETVSILPLSDLHVGSSQFNEEFFDEWIKMARRTKNKRIYCLGDMIEFSAKRVGDSAYNQCMSPNEQMDFVVDKLSEFKDDIVVYHDSNHENRIKKEFDYDLARDIARELGVEYCKGINIDTFTVNGSTYTVDTAHGKGSASRRDLIISKLIRDCMKINSQIHARGHLHHCLEFVDYYRGNKGLEKKYYLCTGSFLKYTGYAQEMQLNEVSPAYPIMNINKNGKIKTTIVDSLDLE